MRQILVLRVHADSRTILTSLLRLELSLEGVVVTFARDELQRLNAINALLTLLVCEDIHFLESDSIVKTLFVDDIAQTILLSSLQSG